MTHRCQDVSISDAMVELQSRFPPSISNSDKYRYHKFWQRIMTFSTEHSPFFSKLVNYGQGKGISWLVHFFINHFQLFVAAFYKTSFERILNIFSCGLLSLHCVDQGLAQKQRATNMFINMKLSSWLKLLVVLLCIAWAQRMGAQGTAFTYQGRLNADSGPANGSFDLRFVLFNSVTGGAQTSAPVTNSLVAVSNGFFTAMIDFGGVFTGAPQWLEIAVRSNGVVAPFTTLAPRQPLTPAPYAVMAGTASNLLGGLPANQLNGAISLGQLPPGVVTNYAYSLNLSGVFGGEFHGLLWDLNTQLPYTLSNLATQVATPLNLAGGTNFSASQISGGLWTNAAIGNAAIATATISNAAITAINYPYKSFFTNYTVKATDVVLNCTGTNQIITLPPAATFPPTTLLTIWSDSLNGSVIITNGTGFEAITVPGVGQGLSVVLGPANSPSNSVTLMVHGGHW